MKRFNNKTLIIILIVLATAFVLTRLFRSPERESNLDISALSADTAGIDEVTILPMVEDPKEIKLTKEGNDWKVTRDKVTSRADKSVVASMLDRLASMKPERIVTRNKEKWNDYRVGDTTSTEVIARVGDEEVIRFKVGKDQMNVTFVRKNNDDEVYAVAGGIGSSFNRKFNDWRDQTFVRFNINDIRKITFTYPSDSGFVLSKDDNRWMIGATAADSVKTTTYINKFRHKKLANFADDFTADAPPDVILALEADTGPFVIKGWRSSKSGWILTSDLQPAIYFLDEGNFANDIFWGREQFLK